MSYTNFIAMQSERSSRHEYPAGDKTRTCSQFMSCVMKWDLRYPGNGAVLDLRLVIRPSNPYAPVEKLIVPLSQYKSQDGSSLHEVGGG
jgi:hypothetical protein